MQMFIKSNRTTLIPMLVSIGLSLIIVLPVLLYDFFVYMFGIL